MKRWSTILAICVVLATSLCESLQADLAISGNRALVIVASDEAHAKRQGFELAKILEGRGYRTEQLVSTVPERQRPTSSNVRAALERCSYGEGAGKRVRGNTVIVFLGRVASARFALADSSLDDPESCFSIEEMHKIIGPKVGCQLVLILGSPGRLPSRPLGETILFCPADGSVEVGSAFLQGVARGLGGEADSDSDDRIFLSELVLFVGREVRSAPIYPAPRPPLLAGTLQEWEPLTKGEWDVVREGEKDPPAEEASDPASTVDLSAEFASISLPEDLNLLSGQDQHSLVAGQYLVAAARANTGEPPSLLEFYPVPTTDHEPTTQRLVRVLARSQPHWKTVELATASITSSANEGTITLTLPNGRELTAPFRIKPKLVAGKGGRKMRVPRTPVPITRVRGNPRARGKVTLKPVRSSPRERSPRRVGPVGTTIKPNSIDREIPRVAELDYSMPDRFGLDANRNGVIDVPNTRDYVQNPRSPQTPPDPGCFDVNLEARLSGATLAKLRDLGANPKSEIASVEWHLRSLTDSTAVVVSTDFVPSGSVAPSSQGAYVVATTQAVAEGRYQLTARFSGVNSKGTWHQSVQREVVVEDILIVAFGDSMTSGEGVPERVGWRTKTKNVMTTTMTVKKKSGKWVGPPFFFLQDQSKVTLPVAKNVRVKYHDVYWSDDGNTGQSHFSYRVSRGQSPDGTWKYGRTLHVEGDSEEGLLHVRSHRSTLSWAAQAALALERSDPRTSVTFVHLAATGATVDEGILGVYEGRYPAQLHKGSKFMRPQLERAVDLVGGRKVDAVFMTIGINDVGFSQLIKVYFLHGAPSLGLIGRGSIRDCVVSGDWSRFNQKLASIPAALTSLAWWSPGVGWLKKDRIPFKGRVGLGPPLEAKLRSAYRQINDRLQPARVFVLEYPDPLHTDSERLTDRILSAAGQSRLLPDVFKFEGDEIRWAYEDFLVPLNKLIARVVAQQPSPQWNLVDGNMLIFANHGISNPPPTGDWDRYFDRYHGVPYRSGVVEMFGSPRNMRWFRTARAGLRIQSGGESVEQTTGTLHPNEFGHQVLARQLLREWNARKEAHMPKVSFTSTRLW